MNSTKTFPVLYKKTKTGKTQYWEIKVINDQVITMYGELNGKIQEHRYNSKKKNIGKANETTEYEQALNEANSKWTTQLKKGYTITPNEASGIMTPMRVKSYQEQLHNVKFPCFSAAKLDGVNAIYKRVDGKLTIYSRGGEVYPPIPHLEPLVHQAMDAFNSNELNGELYIHGEYLQDIQSAVKKPNQLSPKLSFCIFDIADSAEEFYERALLMHSYHNFDTTINSTVSVIYNITCLSAADIDSHYSECTNFGYEGTVIKNHSALYQHNVRSSDMFKYKKAQSAEFRILSYELDKHGSPVFTLQCTTGTFKAKPIGTRGFWELFNPSEYIGNWATVEYETLSKSGVPLKPIFITLRICDADGTPKE